MNKLNYFKGKVCTILTKPVSRLFDETQHINVFLGFVEDVDEYGVWIIQLNTKRRSFFTASGLIGIIEEALTPLSAEESKVVRENMDRRMPEKNPQQVISVNDMKLIKKVANKEIK